MRRADRAIALAALAGLLAFVVSYFLLSNANYPLFQSLLGAAVATVAIGLAVALLASPSRKQEELDAYREDSERKLSDIQSTIKAIRRQAGSMQDAAFAQLVRGICNDLEELIGTVRAKTPDSVLSTATTLHSYMPTLHAVLTRYLALQRDKRLSQDPVAEMQSCREALASFQEGFLIKGLRSANRGDEFAFKVALKELQASEHKALA